MIVLSASNLTKIYGTDVIVKGVDFHINSGDRVGLIGRNGARKDYSSQYDHRPAEAR